MKSFEIKITGNAKSLVDSIKSSQSAMDALIKGIDKADKKLEVLTQTGSHLSYIDKQLAKLKTDYPDIFEKIFPNIDSQINESMKPILQMPELVEQTMTKVVQKMKAIDNGALKATDEDIKELGNDMRILGETLHLENLDMSFLDGTAKAETKIKRLIDTMGRLVEAYYNVNMATTNVDVENVAQKKNGSKKSKGNIKTSPVDDEENIKKELSDLEKYQQILKVINGEDIKLKTTKKDDLEQLKLLVAQFDEATNAIKRFEAARDTNSDKYKEALAEQYRLAVLLKNTMDDVADNGSEKAVNFISSQTGKFGAYSQAEELIKTGFGPNLTKDIGEIFTKKIEKASFSYDRLTESVERFYEIFQKVNNDDNLTDEETDALYEEAEKIKNTFASLDIRTKDFFENLSLGVINTKEVIQEITKMFGIELPAAMDKPEEKIQKLLPTSEGLEKLRIIPDGDQKARISEYAEEYRVILKLLQQGNIESKETISALRERARTLKNIIQGVNPGDTTLDKLLTDGYGISKGTANTVASTKLASKFKIDEFKSENISNDAREKAISLIHQEIVAENQLAQKKKEELEDAKIKTKENEEARIAAEAEAKAAKEAAEAARLQAEEKEKARLAAEAEAKVAHSQSNVSSNNKILLYRYGRTDFSDKDFAYSDTMGKIVDSLKIGFGGFGDGMYSVVGSAVKDIVQSMTNPTDSNHDYFEIDASKYKLFINQTEEEAERLQSFLMNLQKFVLSAGDFRGFDDDIANIDNNSLFNDAKSIFKQFDMKQDEFNSWIQQMKQIVVDNKLDSNGKFNTEDAEFLKSHNFGTRFMQKLGYEGIVNKTGNVEFDGMAQGSVIFDPNYEEIIKYLEETGNKSKWAADLLKLFKQEAVEATSSTENGDAAGSSFEWLNDGVEKAKRTLEEFRLLQNEILGKSATAEGGSMDGEAIGRYTERVETAKAKLDELAKQSLLTADQIKEANDIYETAIGNLEGKSRTNKEYYDNLAENTGREPAGSYDDGYDRGYYDARSDADSELDNLQKQLNEAEAELNRAKASMDSGTPIDISTELQSLENIRTKLEEVKNAIIAKNKAFNDEGIIVGQVVSKEIRTLDLLLNKINDITNAINTKTESFQTEGSVVTESVKQATKIKEEIKKKDTFDTDKENLIGVVSEYEKSLSDVQFIPDDALNKVSEMQAKLKDITNSNDLAKWKSEWDLLTESIESARKEQEELIFEKQKNQLTGIKNTLSNSYKSAKIDATNVPEELQEVKTGYEDIVARINTCIKQRKILTEEEVTGFAKEAATIKQVLDAYTEKTKVQTKNSSAYGSAFVKNATNKYDRLYSIATNDEFGVSPAVVTKAQELKYVYEQIVSLNKSFANTNPSEEQRIAFNRLTDEFNETYSALDKIIKSSRKLAQNGSNIFELYNDGKIEFDLSSEEGRMTALKEAVNFMSDGKAQIGEFNRECTALNYTVKNSDGTFTEFTARINEAGTAIVETTGKTQKSTTMFGRFFDELKRKARGIATYLISITSFQSVWQEIRQGITYIKEIDSALTELKKVTDETDETYEKFLDTASKVGSEIGSTIADFTNATADFARLGYSIEEATKLAEAASVYKNVGDGIDSVSQATESIISTMKAFGIEADNSMAIVDKFNEVGNNFAISSTGIGEALQRSASALYESGNTLDESIGLITAANSVIQNPEQVGTALKTLSLRLRGAKVELEEAGEDVDGMADSVSSLQAKLLALTHGKVDIMADASTFKNTTQILREMSKAWEDMTDIERSAALELMGGKRQANILASIIKNYDTVDSVIESSINSQNSAYEENIKWMDSIEGKMTKFNNAVQSLWQDTLGSNAIKDVVDLGTGLVKILDTIGVIPSILGGIAIYFTAIKKNNPITMFKDLMNTIQNFSTAVTNVQTLSKAGVVFDSNSVSIYAAAVSDLSAKQQALALSSAGLTKQQVAEVLAKNGCSEATIEQAVAEASLANAKTRTSAKTGEEIFNIIAETNVKLSDEATTWLVTHATDELTAAKIRAAIASGELSKAEGESIIAMAGFSTGIKGLGKSLKALFLNNPVGWVLTAISAFTILSSNIKESERKIKESADSIVKAYNEAQDTITNNQNTISNISSQYQILSRGVNELGENVSLSTKEYEEYKNIVSQIESMFPSMIAGYNNEGVAILTCKGNVDELTKAYEENAKAAYAAAIAGQGDVWKSFEGSFWSKWNGKTDLEKQNEAAKRLKEYLTMDENGIRYIDTINFDSSDETNDWIVQLLEKAGFSQGNQTKEEFIKNIINQNIKSVNSLINQAINSYESSANPVKTILDAWLHTDQSDYSELSDSAKSTIRKVINGFSTDFIRSFDSITDIESYISQIIDSFKDKNISDALNSFLEIDENKISLTNYQDLIHKLEESLQKAGINEDVIKQIKIGLKIDDSSLTTDINHIKSLLSDKVDDIDSKINSLSVKDIQIAGEIPTTTLNSWDELIEKIKEAKVANIGDFNISNYSDSISSLSENIGVLQDALEKLNSGSFTMDDYVKLIKDFPKLAKGVDVSSKSFKGLTSNLVRAIKASPKSMVKDLKALKLQLMQTGRSTSDIDQLIYSLEHMPENALDSMITKYSTLADTITEATKAQNELKAAMEENSNEGFETRGEAMDYMKEAMSRGEIGSESNLWNVAEKYGFTFDSAKSINENADALAKFIATREKWFKQDDDGNYTYEGTEDFIKKVDAAVASMPELQELMKWDYNENTGVLDFDFKNKDWDQIVKYLSTCEGLIGLTSDEWADMLVQVGQYFNIDWSNYNDELEYLKKITTEDTDNKSKVEKYGSAMQEYFGKDSSIDLANRPMVSSSKMKAKGWDVEDGSYATVLSGAYSNEGETAAITVTPILPDGEVLTEEELTKYATEIVNGADPATYEFEVNGKTYTGEDIILAKHNGEDPIEEAKEYGQALHEAQEEYDKLRDTLNINTTIDENGIEGLSEIKEIQSAIQKNADGTTIIDEQAFRKALTSAEYTEDQVNLIIDKIKSLNSEVFASDTFNLNKIFTTVSTTPVIDQLLEIQELQGAIKKDAKTGFAVIDTDMFTSVLSEAGYTKTQIDDLIQKIQEYEGIVSVSGNTDPLGLNSAGLSIDSLKASLSTLGVFFEDNLGDWFDGKRDLKINVPDLVSTLKEKGWSEEAIRSYCEQLSQANIEGFNIKVNSQEIDEALAKSEDVPEEKSTNYEVTGDGATTLENIDNKWGEVTQDKTTNYTIVETTVKKTVEEDDSEANGTAVWYKPWTWFSSADGTANAQGNWGVAQDETSLVGELGTELLVRNGKWTTIGENGAEFANIKKGDIIFNHKQTEELLKNGHISSRGKAYANGTAYVVGNSAFARYGFSENGGYQKFDVNGNVVDTFGNAANAISDAADSMSDAADKFDETIDWFEILLEEIESDISLMNAQLENAVGRSAKKGIYSQILNAEHYKVQELNDGIKLYSDYSAKLLAKIPEQYREMAKNGAVAIKEFVGEENEEVVEAINNYREWASKVKDLNQQLEETKKQISETRVQIQEMVKTEYTNEIGLTTVKNDQIQSAIDLLEEQGERASDVFYKVMTENSNTQLKKLQEQREKMQEELDKAVKSGDVKKFSEDWYSMVNAIYEVDASIIDCETDIEGFQNAINDLHWENFDKIITAIDNVSDEAEQLRGLIDDDDIADEVGNWTSDGITSLGLLAQEMEKAKYRAELYVEQIEQLNKDYYNVDNITPEQLQAKIDALPEDQKQVLLDAGLNFEGLSKEEIQAKIDSMPEEQKKVLLDVGIVDGKYSTDEYNEKLKELKDSQYDSIDAYESAKKAIIDLNKTRIEAVKDGIQKEIDAYEKLISKRKEDLSAQKDAHDFNKTVQDKQKEIDKIQRQIDAMEGDTSAAAIAKRKKLQEELYNAQQELAETYYDHDIETQQNALDKELEAYRQEKEDRMEELDNYLKNEEQVLADSLQLILENADGIDAFLKNISEEYGVSIYDAVVDPWSDGADALARYIEMLKELRGEQESIQKEADSNANDTVNNINKSTTDTTSAEYVEPPKPEPKPSRPSSGGGYYAPSSVGVGSAVTVKDSATNFSRDGGNGTKMQGWVPGSTFTVMETSGNQVLIGIPGSGYTGWVNKNDLVGFAKGTKGVKSSQLAMIDENDLEELVLHADGNGKLAFLSKGTSVIPADITENLMKLGSIDPTEMLKRNTPSIGAPHITNNNMELNLEFGSLVHVDNCNQDAIPELQKMVRSEFDNMMKQVNNGLKRYAR